jgi:hypothetical protein
LTGTNAENFLQLYIFLKKKKNLLDEWKCEYFYRILLLGTVPENVKRISGDRRGDHGTFQLEVQRDLTF